MDDTGMAFVEIEDDRVICVSHQLNRMRRAALDAAVHAGSGLRHHETEQGHLCEAMREQIVSAARTHGFLGVWLAAFCYDADMLARLDALADEIARNREQRERKYRSE